MRGAKTVTLRLWEGQQVCPLDLDTTRGGQGNASNEVQQGGFPRTAGTFEDCVTPHRQRQGGDVEDLQGVSMAEWKRFFHVLQEHCRWRLFHITTYMACGRCDISLSHQPSASIQWPSSANSNGIHWYANATPQQQWAKHKEKFIGLVLGQVVQIENLHNVGTTIPEEIGVQWPSGIAPKGLADILWVAEPPFDCGVIRADGHNIHVIEEGQAIRPDAWLCLMPLSMGRISFP